MFPANLLGLILTPILTKKFGKKALFMFGSAVVAIGYFARHFVPLDNLGLFIGISMAGSDYHDVLFDHSVGNGSRYG